MKLLTHTNEEESVFKVNLNSRWARLCVYCIGFYKLLGMQMKICRVHFFC